MKTVIVIVLLTGCAAIPVSLWIRGYRSQAADINADAIVRSLSARSTHPTYVEPTGDDAA